MNVSCSLGFGQDLVQTAGARGDEAQVGFTGAEHAAQVLRVELDANVPRVVGEFQDLHAFGTIVFADEGEPVRGEDVDVGWADFVAVAMALGDYWGCGGSGGGGAVGEVGVFSRVR